MDSESVTSIIILVILLVGSAFFSAAETAFTSLNQVRMRSKAENGDKRAQLILKLRENFNTLISGILIGNNIINIGASSIATVLFVKHFPQNGALISTVVMTLLILTFAEITPKSVANYQSEPISRFAAPILNFIITILKPLIWFFNNLTRFISSFFVKDIKEQVSDEELLVLINEAEKTGNLSDYEYSLIKSAIELDDLKVKSILVPRPDVFAIDINDPVEKIREDVYSNNYSRIIVYDDSIDDILGYIHEKEFSRYLLGISQIKDPKDLIQEVISVYPSEKVTSVLTKMQKDHSHFAVVRGEYGEFLGIVTMEDILELLVGEIWDETDEIVLESKRNQDGSYEILATTNMEDVEEFFDLDIEDKYYSQSIGGFFLEQIGKIAEVGDSVEVDGYRLTVMEVEDKRILKIKLEEIN